MHKKPEVVVTRSGLPGTGLEMLSEIADLRIWPDNIGPASEELAEFIGEADAFLSMSQDVVDAEVLKTTPNLAIIGQASMGYDNLDLDALTTSGIPVSNAPGVLQETTADFAWALLMAAGRRIVEADTLVRTGNWTDVRFDLLLGRDLHNATLGIIGYGQIGKAVARRARGFDMTVVHYDPYSPSNEQSESVPLDELLERSDFVSIHTLLNEQTHHLISTEQFAMMKPTSVLVNASRGPVVDQDALVEALQSGAIFSAALDVFEVEPVTVDNPLVKLTNCTLAPHLASGSYQTRAKMVDVAAANIAAGLRGEPLPNILNQDVTPRGLQS